MKVTYCSQPSQRFRRFRLLAQTAFQRQSEIVMAEAHQIFSEREICPNLFSDLNESGCVQNISLLPMYYCAAVFIDLAKAFDSVISTFLLADSTALVSLMIASPGSPTTSLIEFSVKPPDELQCHTTLLPWPPTVLKEFDSSVLIPK